MSQTDKQSKLEAQLEGVINNAVKKIGAKKENDICRYLPSPTGVGYIHHFTMGKMKTENPSQLLDLISTYITSVDKPKSVPPKKRASRGSRMRNNKLTLNKQDIDRLLHMAKIAGDSDMIRKLAPKRRNLQATKRELIASIRHGKVDVDLWNCYVDTIASHNLVASEV